MRLKCPETISSQWSAVVVQWTVQQFLRNAWTSDKKRPSVAQKSLWLAMMQDQVMQNEICHVTGSSNWQCCSFAVVSRVIYCHNIQWFSVVNGREVQVNFARVVERTD